MPIKRTRKSNEKFYQRIKPVIYVWNILALGFISANIGIGFVKGWNSVPAKGLENSVKSAQVSPNNSEEKTQDYELIKYVVNEGDTFSEIANDNGYSIDFLKKFNPQFKFRTRGYDLIHPGNVVYMPKLEGEGR